MAVRYGQVSGTVAAEISRVHLCSNQYLHTHPTLPALDCSMVSLKVLRIKLDKYINMVLKTSTDLS